MLDSVHCIELVRQLLQMWLVRLRLLASCECYYAIIDPALQPMKAIFVSPWLDFAIEILPPPPRISFQGFGWAQKLTSFTFEAAMFSQSPVGSFCRYLVCLKCHCSENIRWNINHWHLDWYGVDLEGATGYGPQTRQWCIELSFTQIWSGFGWKEYLLMSFIVW